MNKLLFIGAIFLICGCTQPTNEDYHVHADLKVVLDDKVVDFNKAEYMSGEYKELDPNAHMHDFNPYVVHFHSPDATIGNFFTSIGMSLNSQCLNDGAREYCSNGTRTLQFYVNGAPNSEFGNYKPKDLDKILIYYGSNTPSKEMFDSLTSWACVYSKKCDAPPGVVVEEESCTASKPCKLET